MKDALDYFNYQRFDVAAKLLYIRFHEKKIKSDFGKRVYEHHLKVWNGLKELDPPKEGIDQYIKTFNELQDDIKNEKFNWNKSPILINEKSRVINGSHRLACAVYHKKPVEAKKGTIGETCTFDHLNSFKNNIPTGLDKSYADAMSMEYIRTRKWKETLFIATVFPSAQGKEQEIKKILSRYGHIVYHRKIHLTPNGGKNFIRELYLGENWCGTLQSKFSGAKQKSDPCYSKDGMTRVYLIHTASKSKMSQAKKEIRKIFKLGKHSIHINDNFEETWRIANLVFNHNSVTFMNTITDKTLNLPNFQKFIANMRKFLKQNKLLESDDYCIDSSAVIAAYGLRDCKDMDYLHAPTFPKKVNGDITSHNSWANHYCVDKDELIYNPENYFYYNGIKFCTLQSVYDMKVKRNEDKDKRDIKLIDNMPKC